MPKDPDVIQARYDAWAELVDLGVEMMSKARVRLHPDEEPWLYVREQILHQSDDSHRASLNIFQNG